MSITKHNSHDHFWIEEGILFESYRTIRGLRFLQVKEVPGMPDEENCSDSCIEYISKEYFNKID